MMQLTKCQFDGLLGFEILDLSKFGSVTALIGPNGSGKTTILKVIAFAMAILNQKTFFDNLPNGDEWVKFSSAKLTFMSEDIKSINSFSEHFWEKYTELEISIECNEKTFFISKIMSGTKSLVVSKPALTRTDLKRLEQSIEQLNAQLKTAQDVSANIQNMNYPNHQARSAAVTSNQATITTTTASIKQQKSELDLYRKVLVKVLSDGSEENLEVINLDSFFAELDLPSLVYISARQSPDIAIPRLISELMRLKKAKKPEHHQYGEVIGRLSHLLQSDVDVFDDERGESLYINGVSYEKASAGTETSLAFFGLTRLGEPNCLVLWDEPENGLHPTRRSRLLDLMFSDNRQFLIATHAPELAPVFDERGIVFRCYSDFDIAQSSIKLGVDRVADRRSAFLALEAIGVHPAKTLFTANVVIWVEGPTELIFYRKWLNARLGKRKLVEGFHYTFMQYGGGLISYLSAFDDDDNENVKSTFDLLSFCRHPIILVDSDLKAAPNSADPRLFLKRGAARLYSEVNQLNTRRVDAGRFYWSKGREVENYLPVSAIMYALKTLWNDSAKHIQFLSDDALDIDQYQYYHEALAAYFTTHGILSQKRNSTDMLPAGRSIWGAENKVEMMQTALEINNLNESMLRWDCSSMLADIESFIISKCETP